MAQHGSASVVVLTPSMLSIASPGTMRIRQKAMTDTPSSVNVAMYNRLVR